MHGPTDKVTILAVFLIGVVVFGQTACSRKSAVANVSPAATRPNVSEAKDRPSAIKATPKTNTDVPPGLSAVPSDP